MTHPLEISRLTWQGITIKISYCKQWSSSDIDGHNVAHLEVEAVEPERARLPMTETGYRSHFCQHADIMEYESAAAFVTAWLDSEAKSRDWQAYIGKSKQPDLFEL